MYNQTKHIFSFSKLALIGISLFCFSFCYFFVNWRYHSTPFHDDVNQYYSYIIALFKKNDLLFNYNNYGFWLFDSPSHHLVPKVTYGMSIFYLPFFLVANFFSSASSTGYEAVFSWFIHIGCMSYSLIGLVYSRKILLRWFNEKITALSLLIIFFGSNFFCYTLVQPELTHSVLFMLNSIFIYYVIHWFLNSNKSAFFIICFLLGLITLIRPTEIILIVFPLLIGVSSIQELKNRLLSFFKMPLVVLLGFGLFIIPIIPQLIYWKIQTGSWLYFSYGNDERFFWTNPEIINVLFSYRKGWLVYSPLMTITVIGFVFLYKKNKALFYPIIFYFAINLYFISSWWDWGFGGAFGMRSLVQILAVLIIPLACFMQWFLTCSKRVAWHFSGLALITFFCFLNIFQTNLYKHGIIHYDGMTKEAYWFTFLKKNYTPSDLTYLKSLIKEPNYSEMRKGIRDE